MPSQQAAVRPAERFMLRIYDVCFELAYPWHGCRLFDVIMFSYGYSGQILMLSLLSRLPVATGAQQARKRRALGRGACSSGKNAPSFSFDHMERRLH